MFKYFIFISALCCTVSFMTAAKGNFDVAIWSAFMCSIAMSAAKLVKEI